MLGWFKNRLLREQAKMIFQNGAASGMLYIYWSEVGDHHKAMIASEFKESTAKIARNVAEKITSLDDSDKILEINRELRRMFDELPRSLGSFDEKFQPILGWNEYYKRGF